MADFVLDASTALAWCFVDEESQRAERVLDRLRNGEQATTSPIWPLEVANVIRMSERRNRITSTEGNELLAFLHKLPIHITSFPVRHIFREVTRQARRHNLTIYDASYLHLASQESLPLATLDDRLSQAAKAAGLTAL